MSHEQLVELEQLMKDLRTFDMTHNFAKQLLEGDIEPFLVRIRAHHSLILESIRGIKASREAQNRRLVELGETLRTREEYATWRARDLEMEVKRLDCHPSNKTRLNLLAVIENVRSLTERAKRQLLE